MLNKYPPFLRLLPNRVWRTYLGGKTLDEIEGKRNPKDSHFPEDWIGSVTKARNIGREILINEGISEVVIKGEKKLFNNVLQKDAKYYLGSHHIEKFGKSPFFLLKFLDSAERLQIQVHPTADFSKYHFGINAGKTEGYYILTTRNEVKESVIYLGFKEKTDRKTFSNLVEKQDSEAMLSLMHKIPVKKGDSFLIPGGIPHAIGGGILMIEIMEPTDFVARFEFKTGDYILPPASRFMGKDLDFALDMINFETVSLNRLKESFFVNRKGNNLIDTRYTKHFSLKSYKINKYTTIRETTFFIAIILSGTGKLLNGKNTTTIETWDRFFIPYGIREMEIKPESPMHIVTVLPPQ